MTEKKINGIAIGFIAFILTVIIALSAVIYSTPDEVVSGTAGNYTVNLCNGGYVLEDEGFLMFCSPFEKGVYRAETDNPKSYKKILDKCDGFLQVIDNIYYFCDNNRLVRCNWSGENEKTLAKFAEKPLVVGSLVFYLDEQGNLMKYSIQNGTTSLVVDKEEQVKEYVIYYKRVYYIDKDGNIKKTSYDGTKKELFLKANASHLSIDGEYFFFIEDGNVFSAKVQDKSIIKSQIISAKEYAVYGNYMTFTDGEKTYCMDINKYLADKSTYKPTVLVENHSSGISIDDNFFYFFTENNEFYRVKHNGKDLVKIK